MHSRIFQVSMEPINKHEYIEESDYWDHWFTNEIADYVNDNTNRCDDIEWLRNCYEHNGMEFGSDNNGEYFIVESREQYFKRSFDRFKAAIDKIKDCTLEDFANGLEHMWHIEDAYENKFGFYVNADGETINLDSFIRACALNEKYYIGGTIDYHW